MKLSAQDYIDGAQQRVHAAHRMHQDGCYVDCIYFAGLAVECVLRAFAWGISAEFEGRHDLSRLVSATTLAALIGQKHYRQMSIALGEVWSRWKNNYRYLAEKRLRNEYKRLQLDRGIKGDFLKENSRMILENALMIVNKGVYQWNKNLSKSC
jgi:HEPN domain-containing protein